jgi:hypothetical protein
MEHMRHFAQGAIVGRTAAAGPLARTGPLRAAARCVCYSHHRARCCPLARAAKPSAHHTNSRPIVQNLRIQVCAVHLHSTLRTFGKRKDKVLVPNMQTVSAVRMLSPGSNAQGTNRTAVFRKLWFCFEAEPAPNLLCNRCCGILPIPAPP